MKAGHKIEIEGIGRQSSNGECGSFYIEQATGIDNSRLQQRRRRFAWTDKDIGYEKLFPEEVAWTEKRFKFKLSIEVEVVG